MMDVSTFADGTFRPQAAHDARPLGTHQLRVLTDWSDFAALREPWEELTAAAKAGPFVSHAWLSAWWEAFGGDRRPLVLQVWRDGQLVAAAPLSVTREPLHPSLPWPRYETLRMMSDHRTGFNGWPTAPGHEDAVGLLLSGLRDRRHEWSASFLEPIRMDASFERLTAEAAACGMPMLSLPSIRSSVALLDEGWEAYLQRRSSKDRWRIRSTCRKAEAAGARLLTERDGAEEMLERILTLSTLSWKARAGTAIGVRDDTRRFLRRLWETMGRRGEICLYLLTQGGTDVAGSIVVLGGDTAYGFAKDFREDYAQVSPGRVLVANLLQDQAARGTRRFDMLRSSSFLDTFGDEQYSLATLRLFPRHNLPSGVMRLAEGIRPLGRGWRSVRRRMKRRRAAFKEE
jgi:CelD/BcsL family acetyltransferase involved in cellulose biosynthesis